MTTSYPVGGDGSEAAGDFVSDLAMSLARIGPVKVVAPGLADAVERAACGGIDIHRFAAPRSALSRLRVWWPPDMWRIAAVLLRGRRATMQAVEDGRCTHVLALWALPSGWWASSAAFQAGVGYSTWTLGSDIWTLGRIPVVKSFLARVLHLAEKCYSDGLALAEETRRISGREVEFLPSTRRIEIRRTTPPRTAAPYRLLFLGRWHANKGPDLLLDSLKRLPGADWGSIDEVCICGGGPLEELVERRVAELRRAGRPVRLRGYLDKQAAAQALANADYLLLPSRVESIPVVFSDAMKAALPVVATPVGDLPALHRRACFGFVSSDISADSYAVALSSALKGSAASFVPGMRLHAEAFDIDEVARRIAEDAWRPFA